MDITKILGVTLAMLLGIVPAHAEFKRAAGVAVGSASWSFDDDAYYETRATAFKLFSETSINDDWKLGVAVISLGRIEDVVDGTISFRSDGLSLSAVRQWPFSESLSLRGTAGLSFLNTNLKIKGGEEGGLSHTDVLLGLGVQAQLTERAALRLEYEMYRMAFDTYDFRAGVFFLGLAYGFN